MQPTPETVPMDAITVPSLSWKRAETMMMHAVSASAPVRPLARYAKKKSHRTAGGALGGGAPLPWKRSSAPLVPLVAAAAAAAAEEAAALLEPPGDGGIRSGARPKRRVRPPVHARPTKTARRVPIRSMSCGAKTEVIAMPSGYAAKMAPLKVPEMPICVASGVKKDERKVAMVYRVKSTA